MKTPKDKWIWMPHPAHFICSDDCKFVLATKVGKYIVSTVGEYWPDQKVRRIHAEIHDPDWYSKYKDEKGDRFDHEYFKKFGYTSLHLFDWPYETMVFKATRSTECKACPYVIENGSNLEEEWYKTNEEAYKGHMKICRKYANK